MRQASPLMSEVLGAHLLRAPSFFKSASKVVFKKGIWVLYIGFVIPYVSNIGSYIAAHFFDLKPYLTSVSEAATCAAPDVNNHLVLNSTLIENCTDEIVLSVDEYNYLFSGNENLACPQNHFCFHSTEGSKIFLAGFATPLSLFLLAFSVGIPIGQVLRIRKF